MTDFGCKRSGPGEYRLQPKELVFGHKVHGPLAVLKDTWVDSEPHRKLVDYVNGFRRFVCRWGSGETKSTKCRE